MSKIAGYRFEEPGSDSRNAFGTGMCVSNKHNNVEMKNRMMYERKPQFIVEQELFHNNLTFNTLTSKF